MANNSIDDAVTMDDAPTKRSDSGAVLGRIDKYELVHELGEGGFGAVYRARDTVAGTDVAIKGLPLEVKHNESELESIRGNFALVKRLRHPNIVAVTDLHRAQSVWYSSSDVENKLRVYERSTMVVMDYAPGVTLAKWRKGSPDGRVSLVHALEITRQIASALDYAHGEKVLHRDVKPANVMVEQSKDGRLTARVIDFGLAAEIRSSMCRVSREIRDTSGTRPYMSPEQWLGVKQGSAADQYALAVLFYELVAGEVPFASVFDCGDPAVMKLVVTTEPPEIPAHFPKAVRRALAIALAKKPEDRFASCGEFVAALEGKVNAGKFIGILVLLAALAGGGWLYHQHQGSLREEAGSADESAKPDDEKRKSEEEVPCEEPEKYVKAVVKPSEAPAVEHPIAVVEESTNVVKKPLVPPAVFDEGLSAVVTLPGGVPLKLMWCPMVKCWMGETEVTKGQWASVMADDSALSLSTDDANRPVENVTFAECHEFLRRVAKETGVELELPSEEVWETACLAGVSTAYSWGNSQYTEDYDIGGNFRYDGGGDAGTKDVKSYGKNAWGLYDMHGNVAEWCANGAVRGGGHSSSPEDCRANSREVPQTTDFCSHNVGLRVCFKKK